MRIYTALSLNILYVYSEHPKAGLSGFQMVISRTLFGSGFQMPFESRSEDFLTSLDRFVVNKIFFMTLINKTV
jgi:hypothetical protein